MAPHTASLSKRPRLNQILAVEKLLKSNLERAITTAYHAVQKTELFTGQRRTYTPKDDAAEPTPPQSQKVVAKVPDLAGDFIAAIVQLADANATKVWANTVARADVELDGKVLLPGVPVEFLLFLEKRLVDVATFINKLPTLDPTFDWHWDQASSCWASDPVKTISQKQVLRNHEKAPATEKHAAQVETFKEEVPVGTWETVRLSGAVPASQVVVWRDRVLRLQEAVKAARETANTTDVDRKDVGEKIFGAIFAAA